VLRHNLPDWLAERAAAALGDEFWPLGRSARSRAAATCASTRSRPSRDEVQRALAAPASPPTDAVLAVGIRVDGKPALQRPRFEQGWSRCRTKGSQLLALLTGASAARWSSTSAPAPAARRSRSARRCATPGRLYAFDVSGHRARGTRSRVWRAAACQRASGQIAHERDERVKRLAGKIDRVLVDAPCTARARCAATRPESGARSPRRLAAHRRQAGRSSPPQRAW
jgi:16S rRNA (cytosine967-C5)-methyltransferase